jgi:hypothetical protein
MSVRALSPGIAYQRAADVRDVRTFERVLVSFSADLAGFAEVPVTATETAGVGVEDPEVNEPAALPRTFHFTRGCAGV